MEKNQMLSFSFQISDITKIEVLSFKKLTDIQVKDLEDFLNRFSRVQISNEIVSLAAAIRRKNLLTLGDAVIAATAISHKSKLVTNDKLLIKKLKGLVETVSIS